MTQKQIKARIKFLRFKQQAYRSKIEAYNERIKSLSAKSNTVEDEVKYMQRKCRTTGRDGDPCLFCEYIKETE